MADPAAVLELEEHLPATGGPHGLGDPAPAGDLRRGVDAGDVRVGLPGGVRGAGLGDDQARRGALRVVRGHEFAGDAVGPGAVTGQRGHDQAAGQFQAAEAGGFEEAGGGGTVLCLRHAGTVKADTDVRFKSWGGHADR